MTGDRTAGQRVREKPAVVDDRGAGHEHVPDAVRALRYSNAQSSWRARYPSFEDLQLATDGQGLNRAYLATESAFTFLKALQHRNLVVPVVGDFAGPRALRAVGGYLAARGASVTTYYTSNVEQYLFQSDDWKRFFTNVSTLPLDSSSTFIRAVFNFNTIASPTGTPGPRSRTMLASIKDQVQAFADGKLQSYWDVIQTSR